MSVTSMSAMPSGETSSGRCSVTAPTKPTSTSPKSLIQVGRRARGSSVALNFTLAPRYSHSAPPLGLVVDVVGSHHAVDQVVVPLVELVVAHRRHVEARPRSARRWSACPCWMNDSNVEAPIRSPAAAKTVFGVRLARSCSTAPASTAAPASAPVGLSAIRPWKSLMPRIWTVSVACRPRSIPTISGLWSEERYGRRCGSRSTL